MIKIERNRDDIRNTSNRQYYWFLCDCGNKISQRGDSKKEYCNQSGCKYSVRIMHGKSKTPLYSTWEGIRSRLSNENDKAYATYGKRNIELCEEWNDFVIFEKWSLDNGWKKGLTIDRKNIDKNYSPDNCRWITRSQNTKYQHKDGHGTSKATIMISISSLEEFSFQTIKDCARYIIENDLAKAKSEKTISRIISKIKQNKIKDYCGWTFK